MARKFSGVVIDPGHGGLDPAKVPFPAPQSTSEWSPMIAGYFGDKGHVLFDPEGDSYTTPGKRYIHEPSGFAYYEGVGNRVQASILSVLLLGMNVRVFSTLHRSEITPGHHGWPKNWLDGSWWPHRDVSLADRVDYADDVHARMIRETGLGVLTVSLHGNAIGRVSRGPSQSPRGVSVFTSVGQTSSDPVADSVWRSFKDREDQPYSLRARSPDWSDGDADHEAAFYVLRKTAGPAILTEAGFFTNLEDAKIMASHAGANAIATSIFLGIRDFLTPKRDPKSFDVV